MYFQSILTKKSAIGVILAQGNLGTTLSDIEVGGCHQLVCPVGCMYYVYLFCMCSEHSYGIGLSVCMCSRNLEGYSDGLLEYNQY